MAVQHDATDVPADRQWEAQTVSRADFAAFSVEMSACIKRNKLVLPRMLLCCAYWPNLTSLHIDAGQDHVPLESQLIMLQLEILIKQHNVGCEVRFD